MRLNQVTAPALDLRASIAFYQVLGLKLIVESPDYARFELPRGEATFSLHLVQGEVPRENAPQIYFEVEDVDFEARRLQHAGLGLEREPQDQPWLWREAWMRDPAGNAICIYHAGEHRRYPPWRIDRAPGAADLHLVMRDGAAWSLVRCKGGEEAWRDLQAKYADYKTSLGPFDLYSLLAMLEREWPHLFLSMEEKIRAFAASGQGELTLEDSSP